MKKYTCYSCLRHTDNFRIYEKSQEKAKYCRDCYNDFNAQQRKMNEYDNVVRILTESGLG